jgi:hypothetical protein
MPWFPDFANAAELARKERVAGQADPIVPYFRALNQSDTQEPQAGIGVYERGPDGSLAAARVYDDVEPSVESS